MPSSSPKSGAVKGYLYSMSTVILRVVAELVLVVIAEAEVAPATPRDCHHFMRSAFQNSYHLRGFIGMAEPFHFHLLEFAGAEDEIARGDFVAEGFADLGDAEGDFDAGGVDDVFEVEKDALGGFGAEIGFDRRIDGADVGGEHQIEWRGSVRVPLLLAVGADDVVVLGRRGAG